MTPFEFDMALQRPVFYMMRRGIRVDREEKERLATEAHREWDQWQDRLDELAGQHVNVNSPKQMKEYLYGDLGVKPRRQKKKVTTNEDALRAIMAESEAKIRKLVQDEAIMRWTRIFLSVKLMLKVREVRKRLSSYTGCPEGCRCKKPSLIDVDRDGRMRCTISIGGTETMRFSHSKTLWGTGVNMATIPRKLRTMFVADEGMELAELDLNRGESWVYAHLSGDPLLMQIHQSGGDFHSETAEAIQSAFGAEGLTAEEISRLNKEGDEFGYKLRYLGKKVNHASAYRMGPFRGAEVINEEADDTNITITPSQMGKAQKLWKKKYFGIESWWNGIDESIRTRRLLTTPYGRQRQFFGFLSDHLMKEATAYVPQSTSVDYLNRGMLRVFDELVAKGAFGLELLHQNHDSILVQYPAQHRDNVLPEIIDLLTSSVDINGHDVSIPIEAEHGQSWRKLTEWAA